MTTSRLRQLYRWLTGRRRFHRGRWIRARRLVGAGLRLSQPGGAGLSAPQPAQGPRLTTELAEPRWAVLDETLTALQARPVPHLRPPLPVVRSTLDDIMLEKR